MFLFCHNLFGQTIVFCNLLVSVLKVFQKSYNEKVVVRTNDFSPGNNNQLPAQDYDFSQQTWGAKNRFFLTEAITVCFKQIPRVCLYFPCLASLVRNSPPQGANFFVLMFTQPASKQKIFLEKVQFKISGFWNMFFAMHSSY